MDHWLSLNCEDHLLFSSPSVPVPLNSFASLKSAFLPTLTAGAPFSNEYHANLSPLAFSPGVRIIFDESYASPSLVSFPSESFIFHVLSFQSL